VVTLTLLIEYTAFVPEKTNGHASVAAAVSGPSGPLGSPYIFDGVAGKVFDTVSDLAAEVAQPFTAAAVMAPVVYALLNVRIMIVSFAVPIPPGRPVMVALAGTVQINEAALAFFRMVYVAVLAVPAIGQISVRPIMLAGTDGLVRVTASVLADELVPQEEAPLTEIKPPDT
jgi:hypothetical protein